MVDNKTKAPSLVIKQIRECILDGLYKPGDRLPEAELAAKFKLSRSPIRKALQALENKGTVLAVPYSWAIVKPRSAEEVLDMTEIRFALIPSGRSARPPILCARGLRPRL
jgi:DNA-binding GntR family transcriptional regulator